MDQSTQIARIIIKGFKRHFTIFETITAKAKIYFEQGLWKEHRNSSSQRISFYNKRVSETITKIRKFYPQIQLEPDLWLEVKKQYLKRLVFHPQAELAATFYNSVFCKLFDKKYFHNDYIFYESAIDPNDLPVPKSSVYTSYFPAQSSLKQTLMNIITSFDFNVPFENLNRDIKYIIKSFFLQNSKHQYPLYEIRFDVLKSVFYRNKAAYIIGRIITPKEQIPFILPLLCKKGPNQEPMIYADALITDTKYLIITFGFYNTYFMVQTEAPSSLVKFLQELMPEKNKAELYSSIGFHKQGKTEFYRALHNHMEKSDDMFIKAPGIEGLVMLVFTLPSFPYVFKIIKDKFPASKDFSARTVKERYFLVKKHDRVGRMADTLEFSDVGLPKSRFSDEMLKLIHQKIPDSIEEANGMIFFKHMYIQRRVTPLNIALEQTDEPTQSKLMDEYGKAIKDMIAVNIFPGDLLIKNFGTTGLNRIIFYDYDEVQYLLDMNFRTIPTPKTLEQEMASEPWYSVGPHDVFPEQFPRFMASNPNLRKLLIAHHPELFQPEYWQHIQLQLKNGVSLDIFPYPNADRFCHLFGESAPQ